MLTRFNGHALRRLVYSACLVVLLGAFASPYPAAAAVPGLDSVETTSAFNSEAVKTQIAACAPGQRVIGGGGKITGANGKVGLIAVTPTAAGTSYMVIAGETGGGTTESWSITAYAICANATAVPDLSMSVNAWGAPNSTNYKLTGASCPLGKKLVGLGGWIDLQNQPPTGGGVALVQLYPWSPTNARVNAVEVDNGTSQNWTVYAVALCVNQNSAIDVEHIHKTDTVGSPASLHRTITCPTGKRAIGGGAEVTAPIGRVVINDIRPRTDADLASITIGARETGYATSQDWTLESYALCATP